MPEVLLIHANLNPLKMIGNAAKVCYRTEGDALKIARACLRSGHDRCLEFADATLKITATAGLMRELYTHIIGTSRLQGSTRYINFDDMEVPTPPSIEKDSATDEEFTEAVDCIRSSYRFLLDLNIPKEDARNILPLGHVSEVVLKINVRALIHMSHKRMCSRAHWEFRQLMDSVRAVLSSVDEEWRELVEDWMVPQCQSLGYCPEERCCGKFSTKADVLEQARLYREQMAMINSEV